jgi:phosphoribosylamine---glycine ligase
MHFDTSAKVLVLGTGGREHALAWKLAQSPKVSQVFLEPGNAGTEKAGFKRLLDHSLTPKNVAEAAKREGIALIVIGPEVLLAEGYSDFLRKEGFLVFGPSKEAAQLETSKVFAKQFMQRAEVPTAAFQVLSSKAELLALSPLNYPIVLKLDGLAAGKGVVIAKSKTDIQDFAKRIWEETEFGKGDHQVLVEDFISGVELSFLGLCDGESLSALSTSTDHKRVGDEDTGPNTGGMGVISPSPYDSPELQGKISQRIVKRILSQLHKEKLDYRGVLYIGIMIDEKGDPYILEFNARFGDPETQALLLRLESDLFELMCATAKRELAKVSPPRWKKETSVYVVVAAEGYPGKVSTGDEIQGIDSVPKEANVFFSGVKTEGSRLLTNGGRVLGVGALGTNAENARENAYRALKNISFRGMHFRKDIGKMKDNL